MIQGGHQSAGPRSVRPATAYRLSPTRERVLGSSRGSRAGDHRRGRRAARRPCHSARPPGRADRAGAGRAGDPADPGPGRPRYQYAITASGRAAHYSLSTLMNARSSITGCCGRSSPPDAYRDVRVGGPRRRPALGKTRPRPRTAARDQVLDLLTHLGFSPVEQVAGGLVELRSCPLLDLAGSIRTSSATSMSGWSRGCSARPAAIRTGWRCGRSRRRAPAIWRCPSK